MSGKNQFVTTVADALLINPRTDEMVLKGKTLLNSNIQQAVGNLEIKGGKGHMLLFDYSHDKMLTINIEDAVWRESYIALNSGTVFASLAKDFFVIDEDVTITTNTGTLSNTPVGTVYVQGTDYSITSVTPSGDDITFTADDGTVVKTTYQYNTTVESLQLDADKFPQETFKLVLDFQILDNDGVKADVQLIIPQYKIQGNFEINLGSDSAATGTLEGKAIASEANNYGELLVKHTTGNEVPLIALAAIPSLIEFESTTAGDTQQITVYGIRGGVYANTIITTDLTFASDTAGVATVSAGGLVTSVANGSALITVTYKAGDPEELVDYVNVEVSNII